MSNVQFEEPNAGLSGFNRPPQAPKGLIGFLINNGWAKDAATANIILVSVIIGCIIVSIFFVMRGRGGDINQLPPEKIQRMMQHLPKI